MVDKSKQKVERKSLRPRSELKRAKYRYPCLIMHQGKHVLYAFVAKASEIWSLSD